jgi:hypothetical protein
VIVTVPKGRGAQEELMGTPLLHKTPLPDPRRNATELTQLSHRLAEGELQADDRVEVASGLPFPIDGVDVAERASAEHVGMSFLRSLWVPDPARCAAPR